jgi:hypothetical protein
MTSQQELFFKEWTTPYEDGDVANRRDPNQVSALQGLFSGSLTPASAAKEYTDYTSEHPSNVSHVWSLFLDAGSLLPSEHEKLAELLQAIQDLPDVQLKEGQKGATQLCEIPRTANPTSKRCGRTCQISTSTLVTSKAVCFIIRVNLSYD